MLAAAVLAATLAVPNRSLVNGEVYLHWPAVSGAEAYFLSPCDTVADCPEWCLHVAELDDFCSVEESGQGLCSFRLGRLERWLSELPAGWQKDERWNVRPQGVSMDPAYELELQCCGPCAGEETGRCCPTNAFPICSSP